MAPCHPDNLRLRDGFVMRRFTVGFILTIQLIGAAAWFWLMAGGFPIAAPRFWINRVVPAVIVLACMVSLISLARRRYRVVLAVMLPLVLMWLTASVACLIAFPTSGWLICVYLGPLALLMIVALLPFRVHLQRWHALAAIAGIAIGAGATFSERAPMPTTSPMNPPAPIVVGNMLVLNSTVPINKLARFTPRSGELQLADGPMLIEINPLLTFTSCSPDGGWVAFARPKDRQPPRRALLHFVQNGNEILAEYTRDSTIQIHAEGDHTLDITSFTRLDRPVYSHLNTFCELAIAGHKKLSLAFSPCPQTKIDVTYFDYPFGRPATFACLGADGIFRILRATNSEKGPFTEIASGRLKRGDPLAMTVFDRDEPRLRITFDDWTSQLSAALSPTAGWGVPQNSIEFSLMTPSPTSPAGIYMTLGATSVGRGFDSVGHAPGRYRNRMHIERLEPNQAGSLQ